MENAGFSPLMNGATEYVSSSDMNLLTEYDWTLLQRQRQAFFEAKSERILSFYESFRDEPTFGYQINNYRHGLQSATLAWQDGLCDEDIVVCLLHDIGFSLCPDSHGAFVAEMLSSSISERNDWMLRHHALFQTAVPPHLRRLHEENRAMLEDHPYAAWTREFVSRYDNPAMSPTRGEMPLEFFAPFVSRVIRR